MTKKRLAEHSLSHKMVYKYGLGNIADVVIGMTDETTACYGVLYPGLHVVAYTWLTRRCRTAISFESARSVLFSFHFLQCMTKTMK